MALRQREWATKQTRRLRKLLGGKCANCGRKRKLEFDVIHPNGDRHQRKEYSSRISFYRKQFDHDNLQLLCRTCNAKKSNRLVFHEHIQHPF